MLTLLYRWGNWDTGTLRGSLWELTLFCERPTHHPFSCQILSFYWLKPLPPRSHWYIKRSFRFCLHVYSCANLLYGIPCGICNLPSAAKCFLVLGSKHCFAGYLANCISKAIAPGSEFCKKYSECAPWSWLAWKKCSFTSSTLQVVRLTMPSCTLCPHL